MTIRPSMVTVDSTAPTPLARWWAEQTGGTLTDEFDGFFLTVSPPEGVAAPVLGFQMVDAPTPGKNRLHVDFELAGERTDLDAEVERLVSAGAGLVAPHSVPGYRWVVLSDPQGNQFCVGARDAGVTDYS
ncbi:hypothetical protein CLV28_1425 [Sediminihabitans luteus]|uniref:VOC domain-containing protein n=1 Tax=Sediminihabitans luteus TaxID=1138585 RepID=A0A2M9CQ33_9CELL|nr:VOC family protein [Sediminihabitans luteus]PJJ73941.1 hypothetical protein CLV28_1425 [Sediminihabitans luteus]GII98146.1 hypothetical protein Slu03_05240 [Sediminihabitans luteus]